MKRHEIRILPATTELLQSFIPQIRQLDLEEVEITSGESWEEHSKELFTYQAEAEVIMYKGKILGVLGVRKLEPPNVGLAWLLMTNHVEDNQIAFLRWSRKHLKKILSNYDFLTNLVYLKNTLHVNWLNWLGAKWLETSDPDFGVFRLRKAVSDV